MPDLTPTGPAGPDAGGGVGAGSEVGPAANPLPALLLGARVLTGADDGGPASPIAASVLELRLDEAVVSIEGVAHYRVDRAGTRVRVRVDPACPPGAAAVWLQGTVAALVLVQQGRFALHASTVDIGGVLVAVAGASGHGKSTTAALLEARGHRLVGDDVTPVDFAGGRCRAGTSGRALHLYPDDARRAGRRPEDGGEVPGDGSKRSFPVAAAGSDHDLGAVVVLRAASAQTKMVRHARLGALPAVAALRANTYRPAIAALRAEDHLQWAAAVAATVPVFRIVRPPGVWTADEVCGLIEDIAGQAAGVDCVAALPTRPARDAG